MSNRLLAMSDLSKVFYTDELETHALSGIQLNVEKGEYVAIKGPSGCGKSTLLSIMGLMEVPTHGTYLIKDYDVSKLSLTNRARIRNQYIGFVFQNFNLIGEMNVLDNVALPLVYRNIPLRKRRTVAQAFLDRVGLAGRAKHYPSQLSGGQQQRVAVARAMIGEPEILLADEPTGNLDSKNGDAIMQLLSDIHQEGTTVCLVTHDLAYAKSANRTVEILDGKITASADSYHG